MATLEKNQTKSNGRGGARSGAGRKAGSATKKTREIADRAMEEGISPLEYMLSVMRSDIAEPRERLSAAMSAAPYIHPKLSSVEVSGPDGGAIDHSIRVSFE